MIKLSMEKTIHQLNREREILKENWQGDIADIYIENVFNDYIDTVKQIDKSLQRAMYLINEANNYVDNSAYDGESFIKKYKKNGGIIK